MLTVLPTVEEQQKVHCEKELKIAHYPPWQEAIYCNSPYCSLTHTYILQFAGFTAYRLMLTAKVDYKTNRGKKG